MRIHEWRSEPALTVAAASTSATFLPQLGMLGVSLCHDGRETLALARNLVAYRNGHVTGLPLLAPWANRLSRRKYRAAGVDVDLTGVALHTDSNGLPIHGTMTARSGWEVVSVRRERDQETVDVRFAYDDPGLLAAFPFPHTLTTSVTVESGSLRVATTLAATGSVGVPVSFGFHPYFSLAGAPRGTWMLGLPERRHVGLDPRGIPDGAFRDEAAAFGPLGVRTFDDHYALGADRRFVLENASTRVLVELVDGYAHAQLYAPPRRPFVCIEPMTAPVDALVSGDHATVAPGSCYEAGFTVVIERRAPG